MNGTETVGFWPRFAALLLDGFIIGVPISLLNSYVIEGQHGDEVSSALQFLYYFFVPIVWYGYTVGKRILGIRIVKLNGDPPGFVTMLLRIVVSALLYALTVGICFIVSMIMVVVREDRRAIHDFIAGTHVIKEE
ncbi:RDD family protein [Pseudalkalibacillus hwajinpoensis]|uniref:RDD family protein n=1 Tax=Guptibacillus hwajinpoensis TaxID=208199 RepID=UPI00325B84CB